MVHDLFVWLMELLESWGYLGVFILMAVESTVLPLPSEVIIPPAAYWASQGRMNMFGVIVAGTLGSWLGSAIMYWSAQWLGRPIVKRYGRYFFMSEKKLEIAEKWMDSYGAPGVFLARLLPVARHLVSIPAGLVQMRFGLFSALTLVGAFVWCAVLAWFGPRVITPQMLQNPELMKHALRDQMHYVLLLILLMTALYGVFLFMVRKQNKPA